MKNIAVIGSGTMGNGIAHVCAQSGYSVSLVDISDKALEKALATITANLDRMITKGTITTEVKTSTLANIKTYTQLKEGVKNADLAIEAASENEQIKLPSSNWMLHVNLNVFLQPTSSISITKIAAATQSIR